ncbi:MAG: hypothetical protein ISS70_21325 [Phycisphaerae bacterium]|nr:hypothetical protein [Phycisphaerae bacterium]
MAFRTDNSLRGHDSKCPFQGHATALLWRANQGRVLWARFFTDILITEYGADKTGRVFFFFGGKDIDLSTPDIVLVGENNNNFFWRFFTNLW